MIFKERQRERMIATFYLSLANASWHYIASILQTRLDERIEWSVDEQTPVSTGGNTVYLWGI